MYGLIGAMSVEVEALMAQLEDRQEKQIGMDVFVSASSLARTRCWPFAARARSTRPFVPRA